MPPCEGNAVASENDNDAKRLIRYSLSFSLTERRRDDHDRRLSSAVPLLFFLPAERSRPINDGLHHPGASLLIDRAERKVRR